MIIKIKVKANATKNEIIKEKDFYKVYIKAPAEKNKANIVLIKFLSKKFNKKVKIIKGLKSKEKLILLN